ncbi:C-type lectin domain family 4 member M-like [Xyrichtys novacula]|uniref:C-type lectin domain family 4 member M-like n=1 Tax=Xyrichtys novacula TaxID=13765 RepID=A0AAV1GK47_XYRNO|nr:C-type lectin domain family 4 member M-like [Xyrichtys novacula]
MEAKTYLLFLLITGGKVREVSTPDHNTHHLIFEIKTINEMHTEITKSQVEAKQALEKQLRHHHQIQLQIAQNQSLGDQLQTQIEGLLLEKATLQARISDIQGSCERCLPGWQLINSTCYFHSISETAIPKNWQDSRADCIHRGGNLTVIDNLEEQLNLNEFLPKMDRSQKGTWIGLTYVPVKRSWVWLNGVILHHEGYWNTRQPNDLGISGGACAAILNTKTTTRTWNHASCFLKKEWLCEMEPNQL